jgi:hypothetical protein
MMKAHSGAYNNLYQAKCMLDLTNYLSRIKYFVHIYIFMNGDRSARMSTDN